MEHNYGAKWQEYRQLRRRCVLVFGGFVVLALVVATVSNYYFQTFTPVLALTVLWIPVYIMLGYPFVYWRCPRCNRPFSGSFGYHKGMFCRDCMHCGLRKYSNG